MCKDYVEKTCKTKSRKPGGNSTSEDKVIKQSTVKRRDGPAAARRTIQSFSSALHVASQHIHHNIEELYADKLTVCMFRMARR